MKQPLYFLSATEIAEQIAARKISSVEVVTAHLNRIKKHNPRIHAVVHLCEELALSAARAADRKVKLGEPLGKLHGVPIVIKDSYRVKGIPSRFGGLPQYRNHLPKSDCE